MGLAALFIEMFLNAGGLGAFWAVAGLVAFAVVGYVLTS